MTKRKFELSVFVLRRVANLTKIKRKTTEEKLREIFM